MSYRLLLVVLVVSASALRAQSQPNHANAALSINGAGELLAGSVGTAAPRNSNLPAPPATGAFAHYVGSPNVSTQVRITGSPNAGFLLFLGPKAATPLGYNGQWIEIDLAASLLVLTGALDAAGEFVLDYAPGFPAGFPTFFLQAGVGDPSVVGGIRTTAMVGVETRNDLTTLMRNVADATSPTALAANPGYCDALCSPTCRLDGASRTPLNGAGLTAQLATVLAADSFDRLSFGGLLPNATTASALPIGAPTPGQTATFAFEFTIHRSNPCGAPGATSTEKQRQYGYRATAVGGVWRFDGNQRHARVGVHLEFESGGAPGLLAIYLGLQVEDRLGLNGGLVSATISGPQFPAPGVVVPAQSAVGGAAVAAGAAPMFFAPAVESAFGLGEVYAVSLQWAVGPPTPAVTIPLRCSLPPATSSSAILAAIPAVGATTSVSGGGGPGAQLTISIVSAAPIGSPLGAFEGGFEVDGENPSTGYFDFNGVPFDVGLTAQSVVLCIPYLPATSLGLASSLYFQRTDVFDNVYFVDFSGVL